jgi:uncharacterized protein RhaS with RHS repeats
LAGSPRDLSGNYTDVTYDAVNKVYVLTFASDTTHYSGQVSVELPDGKSTLGDITLDVDSTASDQLEHHFTFDGEEAGSTSATAIVMRRCKPSCRCV